MQEFPLVSVVIPFYSSLKGLLIHSVSSALAQDYPNIEVIVVDDCSPVAAESELQGLHDQRLKIITLSKNAGGGLARNEGVDAAAGEFIAFLDYDDKWFFDKIGRQYALYCELGCEVGNIIYSQSEIIDGAMSYIRPKRAIARDERVGDYLFKHKQIIQTSGIFLTKSQAKLAPFHDLKRHQDFQFCLSQEHAGAQFHMLASPSYQFVQIKKINDYRFSLGWLESYSCMLSGQAYRGFEELIIVRSMVHSRSFWQMLLYCVSRRLVLYGFRAIVADLLKLILPVNIVRVIRRG